MKIQSIATRWEFWQSKTSTLAGAWVFCPSSLALAHDLPLQLDEGECEAEVVK